MKQEEARETGLKELAEQALKTMIEAGKLGPGDLIKILGMEEAGPEGGAPRDFVIRLVED